MGGAVWPEWQPCYKWLLPQLDCTAYRACPSNSKTVAHAVPAPAIPGPALHTSPVNTAFSADLRPAKAGTMKHRLGNPGVQRLGRWHRTPIQVQKGSREPDAQGPVQPTDQPCAIQSGPWSQNILHHSSRHYGGSTASDHMPASQRGNQM